MTAVGIGAGIGCVVGGVIGLPTGLLADVVTLPLGCLFGAGAGAVVGGVVDAGITSADYGRLNAECYAARLPAFDCPWPRTSE